MIIKEIYEQPTIEIKVFTTKDIITTSDTDNYAFDIFEDL